jgi:hypothetical protein
MSKPCAAVTLVARPDIVIDRDRYDRYGVIAIQHDTKPILEKIFLDFEGWQFKGAGHISSA